MFEGLKDMGKLVKQAKEMKSQMKVVQNELKTITVSGQDRRKKVRVTLTGELECTEVEIDPSVLTASNEKALCAALKEAFNVAAQESKKVATSKLSEISGNFNIPGLG